jgi:hypothetical protein
MVNQHLRIPQLLEISRSVHILALVSRLGIKLHYLASDSFFAAVKQFTRLNDVRISGNSVASTPETAILVVRTLLGLGTVRRVELCCTFPSPAAFQQIWDGCSENIRHLELESVHVNDFEYDWASAPAVLDRRSKTKLVSLRLLNADFILPWLETDACPFTFAQLASLTLTVLRNGLTHWRGFQPDEIERLELGASVVVSVVYVFTF